MYIMSTAPVYIYLSIYLQQAAAWAELHASHTYIMSSAPLYLYLSIYLQQAAAGAKVHASDMYIMSTAPVCIHLSIYLQQAAAGAELHASGGNIERDAERVGGPLVRLVDVRVVVVTQPDQVVL